MTDNLLRNPGLEGITAPGAWTRATHDGVPYGEIYTPESWVSWWDPRQYRPEMNVIELLPPFVGPPKRIHTGQWAGKWQGSFHPWTGGVYEVVTGLEVGAEYIAGFWAHAWCGNPDLPYWGEPGCAPMGCGPLYYLEEDIPPLNGDPVNDAIGSALYQVGVQFLEPGQSPDPTYGVLWGRQAAIYNVYDQVPELAVRAVSSLAVLYLRAAHLWGLRNNDSYVDDAYLVSADAPLPYTYERYQVVLAQSTTAEKAAEIMREHAPKKHTVGFSLDDPVNRDPRISKVTVEVVRPQDQGGKVAIVNHWRTYFKEPDEIIWTDDGGPPPHDLLLWQQHPDWAYLEMGDGDCSSMIGQQGCFITCMAMAQRFYDINTGATPASIDGQLGALGYNGCDVAWRNRPNHIGETTGLWIEEGTRARADQVLSEGGCVFAEVAPGDATHFVLVHQHEPVTWPVALDPWPPEERNFNMDEAQSWRIVTRYEPTPPPVTDTTTRIGLHLQTMIPGVREFLETARPASVKRVTGKQDLETMKRWVPWIETVYRHDGNPEGALQFCDPDGLVTSESLRCAGDWLDWYKDSLITVASCGLWTDDDPFYQEGPNEFGWAAGDLDKIQRAASFERSWVIKLMELGLPVAPVCFCAGPGNIGRPGHEEEDFLLLLPLARETAAAGGAFGLHSYWTPGKLGENWRILAGRYQWIDEVLEANGVRGLKWFLGEGGIAGCNDNWMPLEGAGWRDPCGYNGNWALYLADILECNRRIQEWNTTHDNRCRILNLFTTGIGVGWHKFLLGTQELASLAEALS